MRIEKGKKGYKIIGGYNEWFRKYLTEGLKLLDKFAEKFKLSNDDYLKLELAMEKEMKEKKVKWEDIPSFVSMFLLREFLGDKWIEKMHEYIMKEFKPDQDKMSFYQNTTGEWVKSWEYFVDECVKGNYLEPEEYLNDLSTRTIIQNFFSRFSPELKKRIGKADKKFKKNFIESDKPISKKVGNAYPKDEYWWLYGDPKNAPWHKKE